MKTVESKITALFKKWIVKRPKGQCQILFSINELDGIVDKILKEIFLDRQYKTLDKIEDVC